MELEIIEKTPLSIEEVKEELSEIKKDKEQNFRSEKVLEYANIFGTKKKKDIDEIKKKIRELGIPRLKDHHIIKIINIMPENIEVLKAVLSGEDLPLKAEDLQKIVDIING